jgi:hypothetical protein
MVSRLDRAMETQSEELTTLRAAHTSLLQLVAVKDQLLASKDAQLSTVIASENEVIASKDEVLASQTAELQRCKDDFLQCKAATAEPHAAAGDSSKRQRLQSSSKADLPLEREDLLDYVFSHVGVGDHLYIGGVCRRWRDTYVQYCAKDGTTNELDKKFLTTHRNVLVRESRLQLALSSGLTVTHWRFDTLQRAKLICKFSLEPEKVVALLRVHGVPWSSKLCNSAASSNKLALLQWLHSHSCPWEEHIVLHYASMGGSAAVLGWLSTVTEPLLLNEMQDLLADAGSVSNIAAAQWLRARGAAWPKSFNPSIQCDGMLFRVCWDIPAVEWALACGSGWRDWKCADYTADHFRPTHFKKKATDLLEWAHANGCPCTCIHVQQ